MNMQTDLGHTVLMIASDSGYTALARLLVERGADVNLQNDQGATALDMALKRKRHDVADLLRQHGAQE
jgi:uncharacterized protein